ncbi:hypothetical protein PGT21_021882 [Puccinia graminis f. sp. tritici]|uniref:Uncharacterized protein n=1 Tax=Puccinia graminis f. sp. tritici TaxID=56615 RepID=A0A5B0MDX0_PUCGR|nr:hypothetical protein PGT21_021882 [Puccinia graminis f. sp. tritici]
MMTIIQPSRVCLAVSLSPCSTNHPESRRFQLSLRLPITNLGAPRAADSSLRFAEHLLLCPNTRTSTVDLRPARPNTLDSFPYLHRSGSSETKQQCEQEHPANRGIQAPQIPSNLPELLRHSPDQVSQHTTYLGSVHPGLAPGYNIPWPVEEQITNNPMHPIQPPQLAQRSQQSEYNKNPKNLKIFAPASEEVLSHHPVESSKLPGLGPQDLYPSSDYHRAQPRLPNIDCLRTTDASRQTYQDPLLPRGTTEQTSHPSMNHSYLYSPVYYHPHVQPAYPAIIPNSPYPSYHSPYQRNFPLSPQYLPSPYYPAPPKTKPDPQQEPILNDEDFYEPIALVYESADEKELDRLLRTKTDSILKLDPFTNKINVDFGYGPLPSLADYQIDKTKIGYHDAFNIDDLYLFEMALRLDELLTDKERLRRWDQRLSWENAEDKRDYWARLSDIDRSRIGIGTGSWWAYRLFGVPFNSRYGYYRILLGQSGLFSIRSTAFRRGTFQAHYPLTGQLKSRFPVWRDGGLGLGRSLIAWVDDRPAVPKPSSKETPTDPKAKEAQEIQKRNQEILNRHFRAEYDRTNLINTIRQSSAIVLQSPRTFPQAYHPIHGHHPPYIQRTTRVPEPARAGHQVNRNLYETFAGQTPTSFHNRVYPHQGFQSLSPSTPRPLKRSVSFTSPSYGGNFAQYNPRNFVDPASLYREPHGYAPPMMDRGAAALTHKTASNLPSQNPSNPASASKTELARAASTATGHLKSQHHSALNSHKQSSPSDSKPKSSASSVAPAAAASGTQNPTAAAPESAPNTRLPKPPLVYTPQTLPDRRVPAQLAAHNLKL